MSQVIYDNLLDKWISDKKLSWSAEAGRDIGVPETVDRLIELAKEAKAKSRIYWQENGDTFMSLLQECRFPSREEMISQYLFNTEVEQDSYRLKGELIRFVSQTDRIPQNRVAINSYSVRAYCKANKLEDSLGRKMAEKLNLWPFGNH